MKSAANPPRRTGQGESTRIKLMEGSMKYTVSFLRILLATLREIFDENAYQRYLQRTGNAVSAQSYCDFQRERESAMAQKPRCC